MRKTLFDALSHACTHMIRGHNHPSRLYFPAVAALQAVSPGCCRPPGEKGAGGGLDEGELARGGGVRLLALEALAGFVQASRLLLQHAQQDAEDVEGGEEHARATSSAPRKRAKLAVEAADGGDGGAGGEEEERWSLPLMSSQVRAIAAAGSRGGRGSDSETSPGVYGGAAALLALVAARLRGWLDLLPGGLFEPVLPGGEQRLGGEQQRVLAAVEAEFRADYSRRREALVLRATATVQGFAWEAAQQRGRTETELAIRELLASAPAGGEPLVRREEAWALRPVDLAAMASCAAADRACFRPFALKGALAAGRVPDRGGRPTEGRRLLPAATLPAC